MKIVKEVEVKEIVKIHEDGTIDYGEVVMKGQITYNTLEYLERTKKYEELMSGLNLQDPTDKDEFELARRYFTLLKGQVENISIKLMQDGEKEITSLDELYEYGEGIEVGQEIARSLTRAQRLGKKKLN